MGDKKETEAAPKTDKEDAELAALLDSALEDFKKPEKSDDASKQVQDPKTSSSTEEKVEEIDNISLGTEQWSEEFIRQAAAQFEASLATFLGDGAEGNPPNADEIQQRFQQMAEAAQQVIENPTVNDNSNDFASTISQTIQGLNAGAEGLQNPFSEQDIMNLFGGGGGGGGDQNSFLPFMQGMMQSLLSKDVLYPSLKDILDKFPDWLNENRSKLSKEDIERYENQIKLMKDVCSELEKESSSDSVEMKNDRFKKVLEMMQKLQEYGQPPTDLVGDVGPAIPAEITNDPNQCSVM